jgi:hypothetical protein
MFGKQPTECLRVKIEAAAGAALFGRSRMFAGIHGRCSGASIAHDTHSTACLVYCTAWGCGLSRQQLHAGQQILM